MTNQLSGSSQILINGEFFACPGGSSLMDILGLLGLDPDRVAIEMDRTIVRKAEWANRQVPPGTQLEIVQFVGGG